VPVPPSRGGRIARPKLGRAIGAGDVHPTTRKTALFPLKKILTLLVLPPVGPLLLSALGLALLNRRRRLALGLAWAGILALSLLATPLVADGLRALLGEDRVVELPAARTAGAIVVLAGGKLEAAELGGEGLGAYSMQRLHYCASLARQLGLPILASGGAVWGGTPEAQLMREVLERDYRMKVRWTESASRDTRENARFSAEILKRAGIERVVLVTNTFHMRRARREFVAAGIATIPAPVGVSSDARARGPIEHLPNIGALRTSTVVLHEIAGNVVLWFRD
jgi:uncharacterized SAM-binding protein YcdF (DUF218 family)